MFVTENGGAFKDTLINGRVHDEDRIAYIAQHISAVSAAMQQGVRMSGYMVWSLLDNFEWASGYEKRFGIVHVDYETQKRTLKNSALWYRGFLAAFAAKASINKSNAFEDAAQENLLTLAT
jgi:beta-glucosidase